MLEILKKIATQLSGVLFQSAKMSESKVIGFTFDSSADCRDFVNQAKEEGCPSVWRSKDDSRMCFCSQTVVEVGDIQF